jgi:crotonobetainyl-CoA:carnitine CoA-transferase CaiB-like acyl-CoA transferase
VTGEDETRLPLAGLRVLDLSTVLAGPNCARYLADYGADVIKVERPDGGDSLRNMAWRDPRDGGGLWWKLVNRNKRAIALDLKSDDDRDVLLHLVDRADVLVENFRPGTLERLGLGPDVLLARRPSLVITRVTGFGQDGPYARRPGFASIAESMSGFAALSGEPDGQPLLPAIALTDEVTGLVGAFATKVALRSPASSSSASARACRTRCRAAPTDAPTASGWGSRPRPTAWPAACSPCSASPRTSGSRPSPGAPHIARNWRP